MNIFAHSLLTVAVFAIVGCAAIDQSLPKAPVAQTVSETASQICKAASENKVRANSIYVNKLFATQGIVQLVNEGFQPRYRILLRSGSVNIHAGTNNKIAVTQLTVGKTEKVSGVIYDVSNDFNGCAISLKDATF